MDAVFNLEMMAKDMDIIIKITCKELEYNVYSTEAINNINLLISALVKLNDEMKVILQHYPQSYLIESMEEMAKNFENIISWYEINESDLIKDTFTDILTPRFEKFYRDLDNYFFNITGIKKAIVTGVNNLSIKIEELIDSKKCRVVAFVSDNSEQNGQTINGIPIFGRDEIPYINHDYLIIADNYNCSIEEEMVINVFEYINYYYDYEIFRAYEFYCKCKRPIDGFITGISYAEVGIDTTHLKDNVINVAVSSQDLFYDYQWAEMILNNKELESEIKFVIIGMSYYSFEYDLSKSNLKNRINSYYPFFGITRNHPLSQEIIKKFIKFKQLASVIFNKEYNTILYNLMKEWNEPSWNVLVNGVMNEKVIEKGKLLVERDCDKDYPQTVKDNEEILREYILFLKSKKITPIVVVCPTSKHYYTNFSNRIKNQYKNIMNKIKNEFNVEIFDYFECNAFSDDDFYDVSHLNRKGAIKFTKIINDKLVTMSFDKIR